jgi:hypothetical protein
VWRNRFVSGAKSSGLACTLAVVLVCGVAACGSDTSMNDGETQQNTLVVPEIDPQENPNAEAMQSIARQIGDERLSESEAVSLIEGSGFIARVVSRDGEDFPATMDYRIDRFNLTIQNDQVQEITVG